MVNFEGKLSGWQLSIAIGNGYGVLVGPNGEGVCEAQERLKKPKFSWPKPSLTVRVDGDPRNFNSWKYLQVDASTEMFQFSL